MLLLCAAFGSMAQERVAALPGAGSIVDRVDLLSNGTSTDLTDIQVAAGTFKAIAAPSGNRLFFLSNSGGVAYLSVTDASGKLISGLEKVAVGPAATTMVIAPTGNKLIVLAGSVYVFDISGDKLTSQGSVQAGEQSIGSPTDIAVSHDGRRAFITSGDMKLHAVDLTINAVVDSMDLKSYPNGVAVGPNGMVYVGVYDSLLEVRGGSEGGQMALHASIVLPATTVAAKPVFTPSGHYMLIRNVAPSGPAVVAYDLVQKSTKSIWLLSGNLVSELAAAADDTFYAISAGKLYRGDPRLTYLSGAVFTGQSVGAATFLSSAVSREVPRASTVYLAAASGEIWHVDIASNSVRRKTSTKPVLNYLFSNATGTPASVLAFGKTQTVGKGARTLPLIVRAIGQDGRPLAGVPVSWSAGDFGGIVAMDRTNSDGYAQAVMGAPEVEGTYHVTAAAGAFSQRFDVVVSGTGGGGNIGSPAGVHIIRGHGEVVSTRRSFPVELEVEVRDEDGKPIPDAKVVWTVTPVESGTDGGGSIQAPLGDSACAVVPGQIWSQQITCLTTENGRALVHFRGLNTTPATVAYIVTARSGDSSAEFFETVLPYEVQLPQSTIEHPEIGTVIKAPSGVPQTGAIRISVTEKIGSARPLPNVAVNVSTVYESSTGPTAWCNGGPVLTDSEGMAVCDLVGGGKIGLANLHISVGGIPTFELQLRVSVVPGPAKTIVIKGGDNQSGLPGLKLPAPLVAEMKDANGNPVAYADATFEVVKGSAVVGESAKQSDSYGRVSTWLTLGALPGDVEVLLKSGLGQATFKATVKGPAVSKATFLNGASFLPGIPVGGIVTVQAKGLLTGAPEIALGECVTGADAAGKLPVRLANMEFLFGEQGVAAPMFSVCNIGENLGQVSLQMPWEVREGAVKLKVRTGIGSETPFDVDVPGIEVLNAMPGVFTWLAENKTIAVANRMTDGAVITPSNPARPGETLRIFATGLGPVVPSAATNEYGAAGQKPEFTPVVILGGVGAGEVTSAYAEGMISVFSVDFKVPAVPVGDLKLKLGVQTAPETVVYGPEVILPVAAVQ
ncbi:MAG TPA: hypothetical protein VN428_23135 [Bryobacteraceae bacterium]|nr:hypothetical protein [Bryobacteraceae bacterium]